MIKSLCKRFCKCEDQTHKDIMERSKEYWERGESLDYLGVYVTDFSELLLIPLSSDDLEKLGRDK